MPATGLFRRHIGTRLVGGSKVRAPVGQQCDASVEVGVEVVMQYDASQEVKLDGRCPCTLLIISVDGTSIAFQPRSQR